MDIYDTCMNFPLDYRQRHGSKSLRGWDLHAAIVEENNKFDACNENDNFIERHSSKR